MTAGNTTAPQDLVPLPDQERVGGLARVGARWAIASLILRQLTTTSTTMVVSRFVSPSETGSVVMVSNLIAFLILFDTGLSWAIVHFKILERSQTRELFWLGACVGGGLMMSSFAFGPLLADFYNDSHLSVICPAMGISLLFNSLSTAPAAILKRQIKQKVSNLIETASIIASCVLGMILAIAHYGYWALVAQAVAFSVLRFFLLMIGAEFSPGAPHLSSRIMPIVRSGGYFALSNVVCYFQLYSGSVLIGKMYGNEALGNFSKAYALRSMPTMYLVMVITDVMVASLAALNEDRERMGNAYLRSLALITFIGCPAGAVLFPMASELVMVLYGPQWQPAIGMTQLLSLSAVMLPLTTTTIWLFLSTGKGKEQLIMNAGLSLLAVALYLGITQIAESVEMLVAVETLLSGLLFPIICVSVSHRVTKLSAWMTWKTVTPFVLASLLSVVTTVLLSDAMAMGVMSLGLRFVAKSFLFALSYFLFVRLFLGNTKTVQVIRSFTELVKRQRPAVP